MGMHVSDVAQGWYGRGSSPPDSDSSEKEKVDSDGTEYRTCEKGESVHSLGTSCGGDMISLEVEEPSWRGLWVQ